jgi:hypothetical protein
MSLIQEVGKSCLSLLVSMVLVIGHQHTARLRSMFNDVLWKMVVDEDEQSKISKQADDYERSEGDTFSKPGAIRDRDKKNPSKFIPSSSKFCSPFTTNDLILITCS